MTVELSEHRARSLRSLLAELSTGATDWRSVTPVTSAVARCLICGEQVLTVCDGRPVVKPHASNCRIARAIEWLR